MKFELRQFTSESFSETRAAWENFLEQQNMFDLEYRRVLDDAAGLVDYSRSRDSEYAYGVFPEGSNVAAAVVSMVHRRRLGPDVGWLKMLHVDLAPEFDEVLVSGDLEKRKSVVDIYFAAIKGTITLGAIHVANVVKLYGRNAYLLDLLTMLASRFADAPIQDAAVTMQGRWFVVRVL